MVDTQIDFSYGYIIKHRSFWGFTRYNQPYHPLRIIIYSIQLLTLWSWLPVRITMYTPILLYTTEEHGCSLTTFYVRVEQHEPTLLLIKTCNNEVSRQKRDKVALFAF